MDQGELAYLGRSLNHRVIDVAAKIDFAVEAVMRGTLQRADLGAAIR